MTWYYRDQPYVYANPHYQGFVYEITNLTNNRVYIGQKNFWRTVKLRPLKGKTNKRHRRAETDWQQYYGSSKELHGDVETLGPDQFSRTILYMCENRNQMNYFEAREQFARDVLLDKRYYNGIINCRVGRKGLIKAS
jgi:hypothetical protein